MSEALTDEERELARHALGLNRRAKSYRNFFAPRLGSPDDDTWKSIVAKGFAHIRVGNVYLGELNYYWLTRAGAEAALAPGETLDDEDFPNG